MANTQSSDIRRKVIDRCLCGGNKYTLKEIMQKCNSALEIHGKSPVTSKNTFISDLNHISDTYDIEIVKEQSGHDVYYSYSDPNFSIYKVPINDEQAAYLSQALMMLNSFSGLPQADWLSDLAEKIELSIDINTMSEKMVAFSDNPDLVGKEHFTTLLRAIQQHRVLKLTYADYKSHRAIAVTVHPYYLKQYNNRWFLLGYNDQYESISTYAFDRIEKIGYANIDYIPNHFVDFEEYFKPMIGVTRKTDSKPEKIRFWVSKSTQPYIKSKKLHHTQKRISNDADGAVFEIEVIINYELKQQLLSYGKDLVVLSPQHLHDEIKKILQQSTDNYNAFR